MLLILLDPLLTFLLFMAGVVLMLEEDWALGRKKWFWSGFIALGTIALCVSIVQGVDAYKAERELAVAITNLSDSSQLNSKLQREALELSIHNRALSGDILNRVIGDTQNPPYLRVDNIRLDNDGVLAGRIYIVNSSDSYSARDVVVTLEAGGTVVTNDSQSIPPNSRVAVYVPNTSGLRSGYLRFPSLPNVGSRSSHIAVVTCGAGDYDQYVGLVRIGETEVIQAVHVVPKKGQEPILSRVDPTFPKDFEWPNGVKF